MDQSILICMYSLAVVASSLVGGWLPVLFRLTHVRMQVALSFVGGMMLGIGLLHMLPHSFVETGDVDQSLTWMLVGLLGMFFLIRTFHFHEHGPAAPDAVCDHTDHSHGEIRTTHEPGQSNSGAPFRSMSWAGVVFGLSLHAFLDGVALAAAVVSESEAGTVPAWAGMGVFLAVLLHKPLDALSITTVMQARGWSYRFQQGVNAAFAMTCPLGAWIFLAGIDSHSNGAAQHQLIGITLAISAGIFLCISLSDLLPEVQFHRHDRLKLSGALIVGVLCAYAIGYFEPEHAHEGHSHHHHSTARTAGGELEEPHHDH